MPTTADTLKTIHARFKNPWSSQYDPDVAMLLEAAIDALATGRETAARYDLASRAHDKIGRLADRIWAELPVHEQDVFLALKSSRKAAKDEVPA